MSERDHPDAWPSNSCLALTGQSSQTEAPHDSLVTQATSTPLRSKVCVRPKIRKRYDLLVEFAHRHHDFQWPELESVLGMNGMVRGTDFEVVTLPNAKDDDEDEDEDENEGSYQGRDRDRDIRRQRRPFVIISLPVEAAGVKFGFDIVDHVDGGGAEGEGEEEEEEEDRGEEVGAPAGVENGDVCGNGDSTDRKGESDAGADDTRQRRRRRQSPGLCPSHTRTPSAGGTPPTIASMLSRCVLVKSVVELWGAGTTLDGCAEEVRAFADTKNCAAVRRVRRPERSWKLTVHTLGSTYSREEQGDMRSKFAFLDLPGPVRMKDCDDEYMLVREIELDESGSPLYPRHGLKKEILPENDARPPLGVYFGRILGGVRNWREGLDRYSLRRRPYLGPTSMDAELSLVMSNLARARNGSFCFDPFAGTGSILLACALRGAYCLGTDIDIRVLRGKGDGQDVASNFREYGLPRPELVRSDNAIYRRHYRPHRPLYDAIVCDPPYGIRAGARKSGSKSDRPPRPVPEEHRHDHIAQTRPYPVSDVMSDLLDVAARTLVMGGRLVYVVPSMSDFDAARDLPRHDCLRLVRSCYQPLQLELGRRVVTMEKICAYDPSRREEYLSATWEHGADSAERCANIRDRLIEAAKKKPGYEEKAAFRRQKRKATRQAKKKAKREARAALDDDAAGKYEGGKKHPFNVCPDNW